MEKIIGINPCIEALQNKEKNIEKIEIFKGSSDTTITKIKSLATSRNLKIFYTNKREKNSQGIVIYISQYNYYVDFNEFLEKIIKKEKSTILILDEIQDPRNFGAIIRSAEVFGVDGIIIPERNSVKINETVVKTSTGAIEYVPIIKVGNLSNTIERLKKLDYWCYGADSNTSKSCYDEKYPNKVVLLLGSEGNGIRKKIKEKCDLIIKIPMYGKINSLNVSVAGGIILSHISRFMQN